MSVDYGNDFFLNKSFFYPRTLLWLAVMLLPIQGSTWVLAILSVNETHTILQYAFSFFCLLKGVYIFVGYCVINKKVWNYSVLIVLKLFSKRVLED